MTCENYREALIESAAAGTAPARASAAHFADCAACRAAFEQERTLFASIDAGLRVTANAEVPPAFVPRVRALINKQSVLPRTWAPARMAFAIAAAAIVIIFTAQVGRRAKIEQEKKEQAEREAASAVIPPTLQRGMANPASAPITTSTMRKQRGVIAAAIHRKAQLHESHDPEILVPPGEEIQLALYAHQLRHRDLAPLVAGESEEAQMIPLQVDLIQIAQLDVMPLTEELRQKLPLKR